MPDITKPANRIIFIASIGNPAPYRTTRHSAGHILFEALVPLLPSRFSSTPNYTLSDAEQSDFYKTWKSTSYMNESGGKLVRRLHKWISTIDTRRRKPTLVILHDELESPLGKVRVKRGGAETASLRGHRGLVSIMEVLRGKGLYPPRTPAENTGLSVMRVGVGIGRPDSRERGSVADYVLTKMSPKELAAVRAAADPVVELLLQELYREEGNS
ncbi:aminoacyl-tRNA hydrolase [Aspergillus ruber CBS 135680]|uniref:Peptidyl-tRNA hydrolase n=1 Tax=Aspergillus ruber (strain CBS 135680) TaxID=1388766 RepID=A0A017SA10_ASPRC|nr:peptidyl-tRNA hydrolase [Aspergillus ruber CBS 135680]EYE93474.1 peptidyl-tRNA hydrolase [Aspergillus ruber CBS 135680]